MQSPKIFITADLDWCSDSELTFFAEHIMQNNLKATLFITHYSKTIEKLMELGNYFEFGIHPNFFENSSQGKNDKEILNFFSFLKGRVKGVRTHGLFQSSWHYICFLEDTDLIYDLSTYMPRTPIQVARFEYLEKTLYKITFNWEDDLEFFVSDPIWHIQELLALKLNNLILNFHPIHLYFNNSKCEDYQIIKNSPKLVDVEMYRNRNEGSFSMLKSIIENIKPKDCFFISDIIRNNY